MTKRTVYCGLVNETHLNQTVTLKGWVQKRRDLGGVIFIDLRDREGIVQIVFNPEVSKEAWEIADKCRSEYVLSNRSSHQSCTRSHQSENGDRCL